MARIQKEEQAKQAALRQKETENPKKEEQDRQQIMTYDSDNEEFVVSKDYSDKLRILLDKKKVCKPKQ